MEGLTAISIKNLRSLVDTGFVDLKPITILLGKNSSGKSTFIRIFQLLKQSSEEQKSEPILWFGRRVDFGSFHESVRKQSEEQEIEFGFKFRILGELLLRNTRNRQFLLRNYDKMFEVQSRIAIRKSDKLEAEVGKIELDMLGVQCTVRFGKNSRVESLEVGQFKIGLGNTTQNTGFTGVFPDVYFFRSEKVNDEERLVIFDPVFNALVQKVRPFVHSNTARSTINETIGQFHLGHLEEFKESLKRIQYPPSWRKSLKSILRSENSLSDLRDVFVAYFVLPIIQELNNNILAFSSRSSYIEPIRATAERYYRKQALKIDEIDSRGGNVAQYLDSLSASERQKFSVWTKENFGVEFSSVESVGHIALSVAEEGRPTTNIADSGFGFSQLLPIISLLWGKENRPYRIKGLIRSGSVQSICIEQPELHLHPAYQARFGTLLGRYAAENAERISLIVETHSQTIVEKIGKQIFEKALSPDLVQVILFEKDSAGNTGLRVTRYDSDGVLVDWPFGFFDSDI